MQIARLLISGHIDSKTAGLILYALQTASGNLPRTRFDPRMHDVILDPARVSEIALGAPAWDDADFLDQNDTDEDETGEDDGIDPARRAGIMKAAEYLYDLDKRNGGIHGFAPKPVLAPLKSDSGTKPDSKPNPDLQIDPKVKKSPARESTGEHVDRDDLSAKFWLDPVQLAANFGFRAHELREIQSIVLEMQARFLEAWNEFFGGGSG